MPYELLSFIYYLISKKAPVNNWSLFSHHILLPLFFFFTRRAFLFSLVQLAKTMGNDEIAAILEKTLEEEKEADQLLTEIAENNINWEAEQEGPASEEEEE